MCSESLEFFMIECEECGAQFLPGGRDATQICAGCYKDKLEALEIQKAHLLKVNRFLSEKYRSLRREVINGR